MIGPGHQISPWNDTSGLTDIVKELVLLLSSVLGSEMDTDYKKHLNDINT
jgi:hypothetical protein